MGHCKTMQKNESKSIENESVQTVKGLTTGIKCFLIIIIKTVFLM